MGNWLFLYRWFRDVPIARKLYFTVGTMALLIGVASQPGAELKHERQRQRDHRFGKLFVGPRRLEVAEAAAAINSTRSMRSRLG